MLGNQIGLNYSKGDDLTLEIGDARRDRINSLYEYLHDNLLLRLDSSMKGYTFSADDVIEIQLLIYKVDPADGVKYIKPKINLGSLGENIDLAEVGKTKFDSVFNRVLPPTMDLSVYGEPLQTVVDNENLRCVIFNEKTLPLQPLYRGSGIKTDFVADVDTQLFSKDGRYLVSVRPSTVEWGGGGSQLKQHDIDVFAGDGGHVLSLVDQALTDTTFARTSGNITKTLDVLGRVVDTKIKVKLEPIKRPRTVYGHRNLVIPDPKIGTLDLETYTVNGIARVYSLGFYTLRLGKAELEIFYINPDLDYVYTYTWSY